MMRLNVLVEGHTEEVFVGRTLLPHLANCGRNPVIVAVQRVATSSTSKGGGRNYEFWRNHLTKWMKAESGGDVRFTMMLDYYGLRKFRRLPALGDQPIPGWNDALRLANPYARVDALETAIGADIAAAVGESPGHTRFVPYLQLHEFEAILFAAIAAQFLQPNPQHGDPCAIECEFFDTVGDLAALHPIVKQFNGNPELINDGDDTSPSKRIIAAVPEYAGRKKSSGPEIAHSIGLPAIRAKCRHFNEWLTRLETFAQ